MGYGHFKKLISGRIIRGLLLVWVSLVLSYSVDAFSQSTSKEILILKSSDTPIYSEVSDSIQRLLPEHCQEQCPEKEKYRIRTLTADEASKSIINKTDFTFIITLGTGAKKLIDAAQLPDESRQLHALLPLAEHQLNDTKTHYYLVLDQPPARMLLSAQQLLSAEKPVGILYSESSRWRIPLFEQSAKKLNIEILPALTAGKKINDIGKALNRLLPKVSSILIIPDKTIYNRSTIAQLLLTGYQKNIPFLGYSKALTKTGALASSTTDKKRIAVDIVQLVIKILNDQTVEKISYPEKNKLVINRKILESLGLSVNSKISGADDVEVIQ